MKKILTTTLFAIFCLSVNAQTPSWAWAVSAGGSNNDLAQCVTTDGVGNVYTCGNFFSPTITFGSFTLTRSGNSSGFIVKQNNTGNVIWAKCINNTGISFPSCNGICVDKNGFIFVAGSFNDSITFNTTGLATYGTDVFLVKFDSSGSVIWAKNSNSKGIRAEVSTAVCTDKLDNIYLLGEFWTDSLTFGSTTLICPQGHRYNFIVKYNSSGNALWAKSITGDFMQDPYDISADSIGNVYIIGNYRSLTLTFDSIVLTNSVSDSSTNDIFIARYDVSGNAVWAKSFGGVGQDLGKSIDVDMDGNIHVTGRFAGPTITFDTTTLTGIYTTANTYILKFDNNFNIAWGKSFGHHGSKITTDDSGNTYVAGEFGGSISIDNYSFSSAGEYDIYVAKFDVQGNTVSAVCAGGVLYEFIKGMSIGNQGACYITGYFSSPACTFGTYTLTNNTTSTANMINDIYIAKLDFQTGTNVLNHQEISLSVYPNPFSNTININQTEYSNNSEICIFDLLGKQVYNSQISSKNTINTSEFKKGVYILKLIDVRGNTLVKKLVKN